MKRRPRRNVHEGVQSCREKILDLGISFSQPWPKVDGFSIGLRQKRPAMTLLCKLERLAAEEQVSSLAEARLKRELKARLADIRGLLERHVGSARRLSKTLVENPLHCEAVREGDRRAIGLPEQEAIYRCYQSNWPCFNPCKVAAPLKLASPTGTASHWITEYRGIMKAA